MSEILKKDESLSILLLRFLEENWIIVVLS